MFVKFAITCHFITIERDLANIQEIDCTRPNTAMDRKTQLLQIVYPAKLFMKATIKNLEM